MFDAFHGLQSRVSVARRGHGQSRPRFSVGSWLREPLASPAGAMACPQEAQVVVVGADDAEVSFTFDALVESEDGESIATGCCRLGTAPFARHAVCLRCVYG
jgi:hypothetical protein